MNARVCVLLACVLPACSGSPDESSPDSQSPIALEVESRFEEAAADGFSGAALVTVDGERVFLGGYGFADRQDEVANTEATAFDVGSIMKSVTATAIFKLDEDGALALDDPLGAILPDVPEDKTEITLLQIVQHRAGFDVYHDDTGDFEPMTREEARARILEQELLFDSGTEEAYSNSGYTLLADVIETLSGEAFTDYARSALFSPAGMEHTGFYSEDLWQTVDTAIGYDSETFGDNDPATWPYTWSLMGNGGLVSTVVDLERWMTALWGGKILGQQAFEAMHDQYLSAEAVEIEGDAVYAQAGAGDFGLGGVAIAVPSRKTYVVVASNAYDAFDIEAFAADLITFLLDN